MKIRLLQAGMGGWGISWASHVLPHTEDVELVGCVDPSPEALVRSQSSASIPAERCFTDPQTAIEITRPDAVLVTSSLPTHIPAVRAALETGKHVLVEKPFASTVSEAEQVVRLADERGLILMVSQNYRFYPAPRAVAGLLRDRALGEVAEVDLDFRRYEGTRLRARYWVHSDLQPLLESMSIHHFDLMRMVLGREAKEVYCRSWNPRRSGFEGPPSATATILFDGGTVVNYRGSWVSLAPKTEWAGEWRVECEHGAIEWTSRDDRNDLERGERVVIHPIGKEARSAALPHVRKIDRMGTLAEFVDAIRNDRQPECSGRDNLGSLELMEAAVKSAAAGRTVRIEDVL